MTLYGKYKRTMLIDCSYLSIYNFHQFDIVIAVNVAIFILVFPVDIAIGTIIVTVMVGKKSVVLACLQLC